MITTIKLDEETKKIIEERDINLSFFIRDEIKRKYQDLEYLEARKEDLKTELQEIEKDIKSIYSLKEESNTIKKNSPEYVEFWDKTLELFETPEGRTLIEGRKNLYNNLFCKNLNKADFWREYEKVKALNTQSNTL